MLGELHSAKQARRLIPCSATYRRLPSTEYAECGHSTKSLAIIVSIGIRKPATSTKKCRRGSNRRAIDIGVQHK